MTRRINVVLDCNNLLRTPTEWHRAPRRIHCGQSFDDTTQGCGLTSKRKSATHLVRNYCYISRNRTPPLDPFVNARCDGRCRRDATQMSQPHLSLDALPRDTTCRIGMTSSEPIRSSWTEGTRPVRHANGYITSGTCCRHNCGDVKDMFAWEYR
jgi:hypothetical protein